MGESHPSPATAPACQPLTEQPGKDLQMLLYLSSSGWIPSEESQRAGEGPERAPSTPCILWS